MRERKAMSNVPGTNSLRRGNLLAKDETSGDAIRHGVAHEEPSAATRGSAKP
jgi:hypothetical protein